MSREGRISADGLRRLFKAKPRVAVAPKAERTYGGVTYHSKSEALFAARLDAWRLAGIVSRWERQVPYDLRADGPPPPRVVGTLRVDFRVTLASGLVALFEVKPPHFRGSHGRISGGTQELAEWKLRHFRAQYPHELLVVVSHQRGRFHCWPDTSLEDLEKLARAGLMLEVP